MVGGFNHLEKYLSMGRIIAYIMENKTCLKQPTSHAFQGHIQLLKNAWETSSDVAKPPQSQLDDQTWPLDVGSP